MKKIYRIIVHVFLGLILLVFFFIVSAMFDYEQDLYLWISLALSVVLSIVIPIRRYKKTIKNKERLSLEVNNIESLKNELNQLSQDDSNRKTKEEELKKLENQFRKDQDYRKQKKEFFKNIALLIFVFLLTLGLLIWFVSGDDPVENKDLDLYLNNLKKDTSKQDTSYLNDRYWKCYGEMTNAHKARGFHQSNRETSIRVKETVCKAYAKGEELNYEGKQ